MLVYIRDDILCTQLFKHPEDRDIEGIVFEINLRKCKWLFFAGYNNAKNQIGDFLGKLGNILDHYIPKYDNLLILGDFNSEIHETAMSEFCDIYNLQNLITQPTCYKNPLNPSSIDVVLTNKIKSFQNSTTIETGLSDYHKLTITILKHHVEKRAPVVIKYRDFKEYNAFAFHAELYRALRRNVSDKTNYDLFESTFMEILNKMAPVKEKKIRANTGRFMNKELSKAFTNRARLRNKFIKNPTNNNKVAYKKQRNFCVNLLRKTKCHYYKNLDVRTITDNKTFWKCVKPLFSEKHNISRNITLVEGDRIVSKDSEVAEIMNNFLSLWYKI